MWYMSCSKCTHYDTKLGGQESHTTRMRTLDPNVVRVLDLDASLGGLDRVVVELVVVRTAITDPRRVGPVVREDADWKNDGKGKAE